MAQPKMALAQHPVGAVSQITVNSDGSVDPESAFLQGQGSIQFVSSYAQQITATFVPKGVFGDSNGNVTINNGQNLPIRAQQPYVTVDYTINLPGGATQGPYTVTVGCAPLQIDFDASGNMLIPDARVPNGGIVAFALLPGVTSPLKISFDPVDVFGDSITLQPNAPQLLHPDDVDVTVAVTPASDRASQGGTVKVGSGGGPIE